MPMARSAKLAMTMALAVVAVALLAGPVHASDPYKVGVTAALTGPASTTYAPMIDLFKTYIGKVNAEGGINGHPIQVAYEDDRAEAPRAITNAKKLLEQDKVVLLINTSSSATFKPTIATAKEGKTPLLFGGSVCPEEVFPPADPLLFCSTSFAAKLDAEFAAHFMHEMSGGKAKFGLAAMDIPISRIGIDTAEAVGKKLGIETVAKVVIPPTAVDFTPFASKLKEAGATWGFAWAPWPWEIGPYEALLKLGWQGEYLLYGFQPLEATFARLNRENLFALVGTNLLAEDIPEIKAIQALAAKAGVTRIDLEGWVTAVTLHEALKACGWPCTRDKLQTVMTGISIDFKGVKGGPIQWSKDNHFRTVQYYKVYRWDSAKARPVVVKDWSRVDVEQKLKELK